MIKWSRGRCMKPWHLLKDLVPDGKDFIFVGINALDWLFKAVRTLNMAWLHHTKPKVPNVFAIEAFKQKIHICQLLKIILVFVFDGIQNPLKVKTNQQLHSLCNSKSGQKVFINLEYNCYELKRFCYIMLYIIVTQWFMHNRYAWRTK